MEGYKNIVWKGNDKDWRDLFGDYCKSLCTHIYSVLKLDSECDKYRFEEEFLDNRVINELISYFSKNEKEVQRNELLFILHLVFEIVVNIVNRREKIIERDVESEASLLEVIEKTTHSFINSQGDFEDFDKFLMIKNHDLRRKAKKSDSTTEKLIDILCKFPDEYICQMENESFDKWYVACFMTEVDNSALWGYYGDSHKGFCLIFDDNIAQGIKIANNPNLSPHLEMKEVIYKDETITINFFDLRNGKVSGEIKDKAITKKNSVWKQEKEVRLIAKSKDSSDVEKGYAVEYDPSMLLGIIFGIKTPIEDVMKVYRIIKKIKKDKFNEFMFYQAFYDKKMIR